MSCLIAILVIIFFIGIRVFNAVFLPEYYIHPRKYLLEWALIGVSAGVLAYHFEPSPLEDLYRYFLMGKDMIRNHSIWIWLYPGINDLIIWRILLGSCVYFNDIHVIPLIAVLLIFLFWGLGIKVVADHHKISRLAVFLNVGISVGIIGWAAIFSFIRCTFAYAVVAYVLLDITYAGKKKNYIKWLMLIACSFLTHPSVLIPIGLYICSVLLRKKMKLCYIFLCWSLLSNGIIQILKEIPLKFVQLLARGAEGYFILRRATDMRLVIVKIIIAILILVILKQFKAQFKEMPVRLYNYLTLLNIFIIGTFRFDEIVNRLGIFLGYMLLPVVALLNKKITFNVVIIDMIIIFLSVGLNVFGYISVFSHMTLVFK